MARIKSGVTTRRRHKKILKITRGFRGTKSKLFRVANEAALHAMNYARRDRRNKKRDFRRLWITRINAAARINGMSYSHLMNGLKKAGVIINRKILSELAISDAKAFAQLVEKARAGLEG